MTRKDGDMQILLNTDHNIEGHEALAEKIRGLVEDALGHYAGHITRVEVHLTDENSDKKGGADDIRCVMEARLKGREPVAVTHRAGNPYEAAVGAAHRITAMIGSILERRHDHKKGAAAPDPSFFEPESEKNT